MMFFGYFYIKSLKVFRQVQEVNIYSWRKPFLVNLDHVISNVERIAKSVLENKTFGEAMIVKNVSTGSVYNILLQEMIR